MTDNCTMLPAEGDGEDLLAVAYESHRDAAIMTLPADSNARKGIPLLSGLFNYFPAALAGVARWSKIGNDKHNPGQPLHHARGKSADHGDTILRHLMDVQSLIAAIERGNYVPVGRLLDEVDALAWRSLALSQEVHERYALAPLPPGAKE